MTESDVIQFWKLVNWIFVSLYWTILYDVGQISPLTPADNPDFLPSTNNIFINASLFKTYSSFLNDTILPKLRQEHLQDFKPISDTNQLKPRNTTFLRSYSCQKKQWKEPLNAALSIMAAWYTLLAYIKTCFGTGHLSTLGRNNKYATSFTS